LRSNPSSKIGIKQLPPHLRGIEGENNLKGLKSSIKLKKKGKNYEKFAISIYVYVSF
jgi:hypothetical protein